VHIFVDDRLKIAVTAVTQRLVPVRQFAAEEPSKEQMLSGTLNNVRKPKAADAADCQAARSSRWEPCRKKARKMAVPGAPMAILASLWRMRSGYAAGMYQ
jgi:hypothetical protein